jgi:arsenate reductase
MKTRFTTYHNPRCGKSRATLTLLQGSGIEPHIAGVSEDASDRDGAHHHSVAKLGIPPDQLVRKGEEMWIAAMVRDPILIERPIIAGAVGQDLGGPRRT